ncbi:LysR family transcriptional regulator [Actinomadura rudentiformis]|uniref:LysR family transcriptional regulator n=1 Tax=Actinomadura rudentiformis TaxID=359158 RepID=A0A6H9YJ72_9ACTN|nr:LysR family transcriptional regulator [Actinomadura rudentiformis]
MDVRRLRMLLELSRLGSMREVAEELGTTTSAVSQQIAALSRETDTVLIEPHGRRVRLTPAGRRLAHHAVTILAAVEAARLDLDPGAEPAGTVRVAGFATAVRRSLLPVTANLATDHPQVRLRIREHEPAEALALLAADEIDLALTYDYNLAPATADQTLETRPLWSVPWSLAVPRTASVPHGDAPEVLAAFRDRDWIVNSRSSADEQVVGILASMAGFHPRITHHVDSLELVQDLITAGLGIGLLPAHQPVLPDIRLLPLTGPRVELRSYAVVRQGHKLWPPVALVLDLLATHATSSGREAGRKQEK